MNAYDFWPFHCSQMNSNEIAHGHLYHKLALKIDSPGLELGRPVWETDAIRCDCGGHFVVFKTRRNLEIVEGLWLLLLTYQSSLMSCPIGTRKEYGSSQGIVELDLYILSSTSFSPAGFFRMTIISITFPSSHQVNTYAMLARNCQSYCAITVPSNPPLRNLVVLSYNNPRLTI